MWYRFSRVKLWNDTFIARRFHQAQCWVRMLFRITDRHGIKLSVRDWVRTLFRNIDGHGLKLSFCHVWLMIFVRVFERLCQPPSPDEKCNPGQGNDADGGPNCYTNDGSSAQSVARAMLRRRKD